MFITHQIKNWEPTFGGCAPLPLSLSQSRPCPCHSPWACMSESVTPAVWYLQQAWKQTLPPSDRILYWRCIGKYCMSFVGNLLGSPAVKEFWKSVTNWQSYRHEFGVLLFWDTVYNGLLMLNCLVWTSIYPSKHKRANIIVSQFGLLHLLRSYVLLRFV